MASCETDSDCRGGYKCVEPSDVGGVKADYYRSNKVCAVPRSGPLPEPGSAVLETKYLGHSQQQISLSRSFHHAPALVGIHCHGFFAQDRFPTFDG